MDAWDDAGEPGIRPEGHHGAELDTGAGRRGAEAALGNRFPEIQETGRMAQEARRRNS